VHLFPDQPNVRNYKTKETRVVDHVKQQFPLFDWVVDRRIVDGCSKRRPDLLLDLGSHIIIVEVDENKHTQYDCSCENRRLMELSQDLQHRSIIFIRFNPDTYVAVDGTTVRSPWRQSKTGILQIVQTRQVEWEQRLNTLTEQIAFWAEFGTNKIVEIVELFY